MILLAVVLMGIAAAEPVRLSPFRQAIRTFYQEGDAAVPKKLTGAGLRARSSDGALWTGSTRGVWREDPRAKPLDRKRYFASKRWLPDDEVLDLYPDTNGGMWIRTRTGVSRIQFPRMTLAQKAAAFEERVQKRHNRHGMVADSVLTVPGDLSTNTLRSSDNDGLWTAIYGAAECYRYAVTKSPEALSLARRSVEALLKLQEITGRPGLPARSYLLPDEPRPRDGIWIWSADRNYLWKADTSSDEIVGHYFLFSVAYDLLPDIALKKRIVDATTRITDHILGHNLTLTDIHGQPTYWGRWDPEYFASDRGRPDSPLNALEALSFLKNAAHITGKTEYQDAYRKLARELGYADLTARYKELREAINYSDEELAMLSFEPLLRYEHDPDLLETYRRALDQWHENIQRERNPLWTAIYAQHRKGVPGADAVWILERTPMDLITWTVENSHRTDLEWEPGADRFGRKQTKTLLAPDERPVMRWNGNPFRVDGGSGGRGEDDGGAFLIAYWYGRYTNFLNGE